MKTKRKNIFKSLLALTLALIMVLGVAPLSEFAGVDWASLFASKAEAEGKLDCLEDMPLISESHYTGNQGDSCVFNLNRKGLPGIFNRYYRNGNVGIDGTVYNNGFEVWIARWNGGDKISWASATFDIGGKYKTLTGKSSVIKGSANTTSYDTSVYFYNGETLLYSFRMTPDDYEKSFKVDVTGVSNLTVMVKDNKEAAGGTSFALYDLFFDSSSESGGDPEISKHFPNGYDFEKDSYGFKNYSDTISKKYFTTLYGAEKGKLLYNKYHKTGGLCFGMAYTTAAIYNGYPSCSQISTLDKGLFKYRYCEKIRDIWNLSVDFLDFTAHSTKIISSALPVGNNIISIEDYIKYAYIYQFSKTVSTTSTWCGDANLILDLVKQYTDEDKIGLTIGMTRKDGSGGHRVLVVGYEGNDILVDDSNRRSEYNRITVNSDGSWTFNGLDNYNSNFCYIRYNLDYQRPFELLQSGKTDTVTEKYIEGVETQETYIEGVDGLDKESMLLAVDSDSCDLDDKKFSAVYVETGDSISANTYWTDESTVSINNIIGGNHTIEFAGEGSIVSATVADSSNVVMTIDEDQLKAQVSGKKGDACTLSVDTCYINNSNKDVSKKIEIVGIVSESEAVVEQIDRGLRISGIESGTVALVVDDAVVSTEKITGEGDSFDIIYSKQEGDETLSIQKAGTPKKDSFFKKILNVILAPFRAIINLFKKLFGK